MLLCTSSKRREDLLDKGLAAVASSFNEYRFEVPYAARGRTTKLRSLENHKVEGDFRPAYLSCASLPVIRESRRWEDDQDSLVEMFGLCAQSWRRESENKVQRVLKEEEEEEDENDDEILDRFRVKQGAATCKNYVKHSLQVDKIQIGCEGDLCKSKTKMIRKTRYYTDPLSYSTQCCIGNAENECNTVTEASGRQRASSSSELESQPKKKSIVSLRSFPRMRNLRYSKSEPVPSGGITSMVSGVMRSIISLLGSAVEAADVADRAVASSSSTPKLHLQNLQNPRRTGSVRIPEIFPVECT